MSQFAWKNLEPAELILISLKTFCAAVVAWGASHYLSTRLPSALSIAPEVLKEPIQSEIPKASVREHQAGAHTYSIQPKADYKIWGLIVEKHDTSSWINITHSQVGDFFNTHDLCVIWGGNAQSPYLKDVKFSHGDWTCYFQTSSAEAWKAFRKDQISNNHILPANPEVRDVIRSAQIGDQIEITGQLVDYATDGNPPRKTSLNRTDVENGACEIIYATEARFLSRPPIVWRALEKLSLLLMGACGILTMFSVVVLPYLRKQEPESPHQN